MTILKKLLLIVTGLCSGAAISSGVFTFIASLGVTSDLAQKTKTQRFFGVYEMAIICGGIFGSATLIFDYHIPIGRLGAAVFGLCIGIFYGCVIVALAEVLRVFPILGRRLGLTKGLALVVSAMALGKMFGSLVYFLCEGFITP